MSTLIKILRIINNETQQQLAEKLGCDVSTFSIKESGKREFSLKEARILSKHYNVSMDKLVMKPIETKEKIISFLQE